jgi:hypothetical protein
LRLSTLAVAAIFMAFAAAGLSSLKGNDFCNTNRANAGTAFKTRVALWPPGRECSVPRTGARPLERDAGDAFGFLAILAAGLVLLGVRRSPLAVATAFMFGMTGLTALGVALVPAFGFGWMIGGILAYHFTRSVPSTLTAAAALAAGGILGIAGAGPAGWVITLLLLLAVPRPYGER